MIRLNRRQMMGLGAAAAVGGVLTGAWGLHRTSQRLAGELLLDAFPGLQIEEADLRQFEQDFMQAYWLTQMERISLRGISAAVGLLGAGGVSWIPGVRGRLDHMRRAVITVFLTNSDYFTLENPTVDTVYYLGVDKNRPCGNPFARFD